jgi:twitching motility protein PilT
MELSEILAEAVRNEASDILLKVGVPPAFRVRSDFLPLEGAAPLDAGTVEHIVDGLVDDYRRARLREELQVDLGYEHPNIGRFRVNVFRQRGYLSLVIRVIPTRIRSVAELNLPPAIERMAAERRGLILVTGTTGSGKSTTLAAMIDLINTNYGLKILTVEDPIEYIHGDKQSLVEQIEVGSDTISFEQALRQALRQDPDVILIGELRDVETLRMALRAADTGHQVFATVHAARAAQTIERIIAMFPPAEHKVLLSELAHSLEAIISQRLVATRDKRPRRPAVEILRGGPVTEKYILEGKLNQLTEYIESGQSGMQSFDQHLLQMYSQRLITGTEAIRQANRPEALATALRGIKFTGHSVA